MTIPRTRIMVDAVVCESGPKTDKGHRALPLPDALARVFKRAHQRQTEDRPLLGVDHLEGGYVVADRGGSPMHPRRWGSPGRDCSPEPVRASCVFTMLATPAAP